MDILPNPGSIAMASMSSASRFVRMYVVEAKRESEYPSWDRRGGCATKRMAPFLIGEDGVVRNGAKRPYRRPRSAPFQSVRFANINKVASHHWSTTPPFAKRRANGTPPNLGGEFLRDLHKCPNSGPLL